MKQSWREEYSDKDLIEEIEYFRNVYEKNIAGVSSVELYKISKNLELLITEAEKRELL